MNGIGHKRVFFDNRTGEANGWRVLLTAGARDIERYREAIISDPAQAEMMHLAFVDACVEFEEAVVAIGYQLGDDISVPGSAHAGFLQIKRRLSHSDAKHMIKMRDYLEERFDALLESNFEMNERKPGVR